MSTVFISTYPNISMEYRQIKLNDLIDLNYNLDIRRYFVKKWKRFLDECEILLKIDLIRPDALPAIPNSLKNNIKFSMELSDSKIPFFDILIAKSGKKVWINIYSKPANSKRYVSCLSNLPKPCHSYVPFYLARRICMIVEDKNVNI